jgi:hypothetical protein
MGRSRQISLRIKGVTKTLTTDRPILKLPPITAGGLPSAPGGLGPAGSILGPGKPAPVKQRAAFYIDGFNLYHAIDELKKPHLKWLNLWKLCEALIVTGQETVVSVHWCSAEHAQHSDKRLRARAYRKALEATGVTPLMGHFAQETRKCKATCGENYLRDVEKQGDINVAIQIIRDGYANTYDVCYLVTADADQVATVKAFRELFPAKRLIATFPPLRESKRIEESAHGRRDILEETMAQCLFPKDVTARGRFIVSRPERYAPLASVS